jgi:uncharacterized protein
VIRVVLDTNILISALLNPQGPPAQVFLMAILEADIQLCVSDEIFAEYAEVIARSRLKRSANEIDNTLRAIRLRSLWIKPISKTHASPDPDDNIFMECAESAAAHYLVTGNLKHFPSAWAGTRIVTARQFLDDVV